MEMIDYYSFIDFLFLLGYKFNKAHNNKQ